SRPPVRFIRRWVDWMRHARARSLRTRARDCKLSGERRNIVTECKLDLSATFYLDRNVPANGEVTSVTATGGDAQHGAVAFATTHWSVVLTAQGESPAAQEALEKLCRTYWRPIYGFVRRQGAGPEEADDLTQGFFVLMLERRDVSTVRKEQTSLG